MTLAFARIMITCDVHTARMWRRDNWEYDIMTMKCKDCNIIFYDSVASFCPYCGEELDEIEDNL